MVLWFYGDLCCLPKIHKANTPSHPIVSGNGTLCENLSGYPLYKEPPAFVATLRTSYRNSAHMEQLNQEHSSSQWMSRHSTPASPRRWHCCNCLSTQCRQLPISRCNSTTHPLHPGPQCLHLQQPVLHPDTRNSHGDQMHTSICQHLHAQVRTRPLHRSGPSTDAIH